MKKIAFVFWCFVCLSVIFFFPSCRKKSSDRETIVLKAADIHGENYPTVLGLKEFSRLVKQRSGGRIIIEVISGGAAGTEIESMEKVQFGKLDFARVSISPLSSIVPNLEMLLLPGEFTSELHFWKVIDGPIGDSLLKDLEKYGFYGLCYYDSGARSFYTSTKITSLSDLKGMKIRVQRSPIMLEFINALGAIPVPLSFQDVEKAFEDGSLDAAENNIPSYETSGHYKKAPYYFKNNHMRMPEVIVGSKKTLSQLPESDLKIIFDAAKDSAALQNLLWLEYEQTAEEKLKNEGVQFINPNQNELKMQMEKLNKDFFKKFTPEQQKLIRQIESAL